MFREDYKEARRIFNEVIKKYPKKKGLAAEAAFAVGKTYELEANWVKASKVYGGIMVDYPGTSKALSVPIYIANYFRKQNNFQRTMEAYETAIAYYRRAAEEYKGKRQGMNALRFLSNCYLEQNRWQEAVDTLGKVLDEYATTGFLTIRNVDLTIKTINILCAYKLDDYDIAISLYQGMIDRHPERPFNAYLQKNIDAFKQLKEKGVRFIDQGEAK